MQAKCGFDSVPGGAPGSLLLAAYGPTLLVDVGFDPSFQIGTPGPPPAAGMKGINALVDTGAAQSSIDSLLATQLNLPVVDRKPVSGVHGSIEVNMHLAQVAVPSLRFTIYGVFAGVHLVAGGQQHRVLIGRTFLAAFTMVYEGRTGNVTISSD